MLPLAITTPSHHAAHVPAWRGEAIVTRNLTGIFATDVLAPASRGLKKPADLREDLLDWETSILLGPFSSCNYHFPSLGQHGEPAAEKTACREPPADSPRLEIQATRRATNTEPDRRASVTFLFPCAFMLAALSLAACRGLLCGRKEKKSMHGRTRAAGAAAGVAHASGQGARRDAAGRRGERPRPTRLWMGPPAPLGGRRWRRRRVSHESRPGAMERSSTLDGVLCNAVPCHCALMGRSVRRTAVLFGGGAGGWQCVPLLNRKHCSRL